MEGIHINEGANHKIEEAQVLKKHHVFKRTLYLVGALVMFKGALHHFWRALNLETPPNKRSAGYIMKTSPIW